MSVVIQVNNISKQYRLGQVGTGTLSHDLNSWWHRIRGKEDPYLKVGEENDRSRKGGSDYAWALRDVSFSVNDGEVLGIIGRNGAGKSTLLKILSRTTAPSTGNIRVKGRVASLLEVGTGFHPELTGKENIFLNGAILGMNRHEIKRKFDEIVDFAGVERYIDTPVKRYSSGMYVRLAFGVAAHLESEILVVDEVLAVGDGEFQKKCLGKMRDVSTNEGRTVLFVSHQMGTIANLCTRSVLMQNGRLVKDGPTGEVINYYLAKANSGTGDGYTYDEASSKSKDVLFTKIRLVDANGNAADQFSFSERIYFELSIKIRRNTNNTFIGIGLQDKNNTRVSTFVNKLSDFADGSEQEIELKVELPSGLIAPNHYSFVMALFEPAGKVHDIAENICPAKIVDTGSDYAIFEGIDYGSFMIDAKWHLQKRTTTDEANH